MEFYETKLKYERMDDGGVSKKVCESYLVDALSFAEAEARIIEEMTPYISGEFEVSAVKKNKIAEVFGDEERFYMAKVLFVTLDEKSGAEKKSASNMLVRAKDFEDALSVLKDGMKGTLSDWEIASIAETPIMDIFYKKDDDTTTHED